MPYRDFDGAEIKSARKSFLLNSAAHPTPAILYAAWLAAFEAQGGKPYGSFDRNYEEPGSVLTGGIGADLVLEVQPAPIGVDYDHFGLHHWTPTVWRKAIPTGYGALSLDLLILPDLLGIPAKKVNTLRRPTSGDNRPGWEWGHTSVFMLRWLPDENRFEAWTNSPYKVHSYRDVDALIIDGSADQFLQALREWIDPTSHRENQLSKQFRTYFGRLTR